MRPLSSEWPLWSEVRTILPLKLWHCAQVAAEKERSFSSCFVASASSAISSRGSFSANNLSAGPHFLASRLLLARSLEIRVESPGLCVCTLVWSGVCVCVLRGDSLLRYRNASKAGARFHRCPILAKPWRTIGKQQPLRGISLTLSLSPSTCVCVCVCMCVCVSVCV